MGPEQDCDPANVMSADKRSKSFLFKFLDFVVVPLRDLYLNQMRDQLKVGEIRIGELP